MIVSRTGHGSLKVNTLALELVLENMFDKCNDKIECEFLKKDICDCIDKIIRKR